MERILSQDEIAELLSAVKDGEIDTEAEVASSPDESKRVVSRLDLVVLPGFGRWKIPNLDIIFDDFGRNYGISLTNRMQRPVGVELKSIDSMGFNELLKMMPEHSAIGVLTLDPFKAGGLLIFNSALAFTTLEFQLGGALEGKVKTLHRPMTSIEQNLLKVIMEDSVGDLQKAFKPLVQIKPALVKIENNPRLVNIVPGDSGVLTVKFVVTIEQHQGELMLVIPHVSLEPLREQLRDSVISLNSQQSETWPNLLMAGLEEIETDIFAQVGEVALKVRDILNLKIGDIVDLGCAPKSPVTVKVEGHPKYLATVGTKDGNRAIKILGKFERSK